MVHRSLLGNVLKYEEEVSPASWKSLGLNSEVFQEERPGCRISHLYLEDGKERRVVIGTCKAAFGKEKRRT